MCEGKRSQLCVSRHWVSYKQIKIEIMIVQVHETRKKKKIFWLKIYNFFSGL